MKSSVMMEYPKYHIQSLHLADGKILVGTRNGDIYEIMYHKDKLKGEVIENEIQKRLSCCDHEIPNVVDFSANNGRIFYLSDYGYFCVWKTTTL